MAHVHPSAVVSGDVELADDVVVGPSCVLVGRIRIGPGTTLISQVHLHGPLEMGARNVCYPGVCIGYAPQDLKWDPARDGAGLVIGDGNTFREHFTAHRATKDDRPTTIGHRNFWMANSHVGHDCVVGNDCVCANGATLGGHVQLGDRVVLGGFATIHQFVRVGRGAMFSGLVGSSSDVCPFFLITGINYASGVNVVGMRRAGLPRASIDAARWCYRTLARSGLMPRAAVAALRERESDPIVREYIEFIESSKRPIAVRRGRRATNQAAEAATTGGGDGE